MTQELIVRKPQDKTELRIARENRKAVSIQANADLLKELIKNPVFEILTAVVAIEALQKANVISDRGWLNAGTIAESGIMACVFAQQIAPLMPYVAQSAEGLGKVVSSLAPLALLPK